MPMWQGGKEPRIDASRSSESLGRPRTSALRLDFAVARLGARFERVDQSPRDRGDLLDRLIEGSFVRFRGLVESRKLSRELQRSGADLIIRCGRIEIEECLDIPAHG